MSAERSSVGAVTQGLNIAEPAARTPDSPYHYLHRIAEHDHSASKVYPTLASGITVTAGASWVLGSFATIVPASTIGEAFDIHHVSVEDISANDVYELVLYYGATDIEAGRVRFTRSAIQDSTMNVPFQTIVIPADSQIRAKLASATGGDNVTISIKYHTY